MLTQAQIEIVRKMCRVQASGSPIILGIYSPYGVVTKDQMVEIMGHDNFRLLDFADHEFEDDRMISVINDVNRQDGEFIRGITSRLRFRNQIICILSGSDHTPQFLSQISIINPEAKP